MVAHLKLLIAKLKRERFGPSSEQQRRLLDQLELQLEELEATATENDCAAETAAAKAGESVVKSFSRRKPVRAPLPAHLPRERVVIPAPSLCPCCQGKLVKLGEDVTETLEVIPRQWKVIRTHPVRTVGPLIAVLVDNAGSCFFMKWGAFAPGPGQPGGGRRCGRARI